MDNQVSRVVVASAVATTSAIAQLFSQKVVGYSLTTLGAIWVGKQAYKLLYFVHFHFLHRSSVAKYNSGADSGWALVTGSSDGIGKGFAEELCARGFNVVLHGRNEKKLQGVRNDLLREWPEREVRLLVLEAQTAARNPTALQDAVRQAVSDVNLTVLVNNVGGSGGLKPAWQTFSRRTAEDNHMFIDLNAMFATEITRVLVSSLTKDNKPALIMNIGSITSEVPCAYGSVYSGTKAYNKAWSRSLALEMKAEGFPVEVMNVLVGSVSTGSQPADLDLFCIDSRSMARYSLDKVGCGQDVFWGYWAHQLECDTITSLPKRFMEHVILGYASKEKAQEEAAMQASLEK